MLVASNRLWHSVIEGLKKWGEDEYVNDYLSQMFLRNIDKFIESTVTEQKCIDLREQIAEEQMQLKNELRDLQEKYRKISEKLD